MITVGFSKSKVKFPFIAWLIMLCEGTKFSHCYIRIWSESLQRDLIYQATGSGVYFVGTVAFDEHHQIVEEYQIHISAEDRKRLLQWAVDNSGKGYSRLQFVGIGIKRLAKLFGKNIANPFADGNKGYVCTELVAEATKNIEPKLTLDQDSIGLREIHDHIVEIVEYQRAS